MGAIGVESNEHEKDLIVNMIINQIDSIYA